MFALNNQQAKLTSVNPRAEKHGVEHVMAADLNFDVEMSNNVLSEFDPKLKASMYSKGDVSQGSLVDEISDLRKLNFPSMGTLAWDCELVGYQVDIEIGISGDANIGLAECQVDKFKFECKEGGTVVVKFRVIAHPSADELGRLCEMIQQNLSLSLTEPPAPVDSED
ncbi:MAG: hypothetical protein WAU16_16260 [Rhizobiaceae bacterium]